VSRKNSDIFDPSTTNFNLHDHYVAKIPIKADDFVRPDHEQKKNKLRLRIIIIMIRFIIVRQIV